MEELSGIKIMIVGEGPSDNTLCGLLVAAGAGCGVYPAARMSEMYKELNEPKYLDITEMEMVYNTIEEPTNEKEPTTDDFVFGPPQRMKDEDFEDYKKRRKSEKLQLKILNKYGRRQWAGKKGTFRKQP